MIDIICNPLGLPCIAMLTNLKHSIYSLDQMFESYIYTEQLPSTWQNMEKNDKNSINLYVINCHGNYAEIDLSRDHNEADG